MLRLHRDSPRMAALGMIDMFAGRATDGAVAAAIRYQAYIEATITTIKKG
jgi:hypothetical protein